MAELLVASGSVSVPITEAVFESIPCVLAFTLTTSVMLADTCGLRIPMGQVTVAVPVHVPCVGVAETKVTPAGKVSVTLTPVAWEGPLLATPIVYVRLLPGVTGSGLSVFVIARSVEAFTVVKAVAELFVELGSLSVPLTVAILLSVPRVSELTVTVIVMLPMPVDPGP